MALKIEEFSNCQKFVQIAHVFELKYQLITLLYEE